MGARLPGLLLMASMVRAFTVQQVTSTNSSTLDSNRVRGSTTIPTIRVLGMGWYHDHAMDLTRLNAYAGIASAYIIRDSFEANLRNLGLPDFVENGGREIPIVIQDKIFVGSNILDQRSDLARPNRGRQPMVPS